MSGERSTLEVLRVLDRSYQAMNKEIGRVECVLQAMRDRQRMIDDGHEPLESIVTDAFVALIEATAVLGGHADMLQSFATQTVIEGLDDSPEST
jgi:hypothetical protein